MKSLGICVGASTLSVVEAQEVHPGRIETKLVITTPHNGNPREAILKALADISLDTDTKIAVTGRRLRQSVELSTITEPEAVETALYHLNGRGNKIDAIVSAGGENFLVYVLGKDGRICSVKTGNKCASGTGEFFVQQLRRVGLSLDDAAHYAKNERPYRVSGRCSVFCKSDCTHASNKGIPKGRIVAGLSEMIAGKIMEILRQTPSSKKIMIIGGLARNRVVIDYLTDRMSSLVVPEEAFYFEALGAAIWALGNETAPFPGVKKIFKGIGKTFSYLLPLSDFKPMVEFRDMERGVVREGDRCILGLDVGSTTTKAVLMRVEDHRILNSVYLRTNGNPVEASRACFASLYDQLGMLAEKIEISGIGVTGSGRQIAGLYAMTDGVINEIIAHAAGALFYDDAVDTIFEIGGQDAKYTCVNNGVAADYAMNDACSAGTGSFLEEAAKETMGIETDAIGTLALMGKRPPNFNDQCAAFISSDIKNAFQDGLTKEDILAGLVYSICMNYNNRVKGNRPVGKKIFMQGGVCYNRAVPMAMASLTGKRIVVPPEPGLVGAFGVALEVLRRFELGILKEKSFSLKILKERTVEQREPFICNGGKNKCDRKCEITRIRIEGKTHPFGGACNRWYNMRGHIAVDTEKLDLVKQYEKLIFTDHFKEQGKSDSRQYAVTIGINKSFFVNSFYPLYHHFFHRLGFRVQMPEFIDQEGVDYKGAAFCYPAEISHGYFLHLLKKKPDYLFLPHFKGMKVDGECGTGLTCPFAQGEPYYLTTAFKDNEVMADLQKQGKVLKPVLDFSNGDGEAAGIFESMARIMGVDRKEARKAFTEAQRIQENVAEIMKQHCLNVLKDLEKDPERFAIAILGRSYNAFVSEANMGIPLKIASRGVPVLPYAFLPLGGYEAPPEMYWGTGRMILKAAQFIAGRQQLFACYITNFSCGPDSFLVEYFRHAMGRKPFLILELDSHVADAGLETRIEAFLDIIKNHRELERRKKIITSRPAVTFAPASFHGKRQIFVDSRGEECDLRDPRVNVLIPSMGVLGNCAAAAVFRSFGIRATALPPADEEALKLGRGNTSCKECLPLLLTLGSLLKYVKDEKKRDEHLLYFMPTASGPCRFGQYSFFIDHMIKQLGIEDAAIFSLQAENSYKDLGGRNFILKLLSGVILSDIFQDIYSLLLVNAADKKKAIGIYREEWERIIKTLEVTPDFASLKAVLAKVFKTIHGISIIKPWLDVPTILLTGEIFVRHDDLSRQFMIERLAEQGFASKTAGLTEWIYYTDYCYVNKLAACRPSFNERPSLLLRSLWMKGYERAYKNIAKKSGLMSFKRDDVEHMIKVAGDLISPQLTGEAILTVGGAISEVPRHYCGVISIGPFGCMPNRLSEAILSQEMGRGWQTTGKRRCGASKYVLENIYELPFLAIESDGNPFPQVITAKLEVFLSQAARLYRAMKNRD
ncbi:MAG TPA: acyl-CoA dehydratase activase [Syntrophales bacterium]|nr:acyl-CoA dehydratase activase [Syntrophales bacterium]